jgi:hypothetical protein
MSGGEEYVGRPERIRDEDTLARFVESPWSDPRAVVDRSDSKSDMGRLSDRGRRHLGHLATRAVVVLPQLTHELGELGVTAAATPMSDLERGSSS